jgi:tight adherence protein C
MHAMDTATALNLFAAAAAAAASILAVVAWRRARVAATGPGVDGVEGQGPLRMLVAPLATALRPTTQAELDHLTTQLLNAGRRSRDAIDRYCEERILTLFAGLGLALLASWAIGGFSGLLLALVSIVLGILGPSKVLAMKARERRDAIAQGLPPAVDLMTTCIEAGLSLEQTLSRVAREIERSAPTLAEELETTANELDAGVSLPDSLRRLARRVGLDDLSALCGVIAQAHGLGAPVAATLREYAQSSRRQRMAMLEERAGKLAAQMTVPLAVCLLPAALLTILGPAIIQLVRALQ